MTPVPRPLGDLSFEDWKQLLGRKVSLRYRLADDPAHPFSEAIGVVQAVERRDGDRPTVAVISKRGEVRVVDLAAIVAGKVWPAARV